ncbi:hypothetical protein Pelo_13123 [Pelomyxa schiedti]|nr:hypothetical protein Pelo_13123 [Pelomyxa schiedti]
MHRDAGKAAEAAHHTQEKMMTLAGPYLQQFLQRAGYGCPFVFFWFVIDDMRSYKTALVPHMEPGYFQEIKDLLLRGTKYVIISTSFVYATELLGMPATLSGDSLI